MSYTYYFGNQQNLQKRNPRTLNHYNKQKQNVQMQNINEEPKHARSTSSTNQYTHPKSSTDNLHELRLQSQILELQKAIDQQQYQLQILNQQATHFMKTCEEQKETLLALNIEAMRNEYQQQISELMAERLKVQDIICQLHQDYQQAYLKQEHELDELRLVNQSIGLEIEKQLERKRSLLAILANRDKEIEELEFEARLCEERIDELRNIQRKLAIAIREIEQLSG